MLNDPEKGLRMIIPFAKGEGDITLWFSKESGSIGLRVQVPDLDDPHFYKLLLTIELSDEVVHRFLLNYPDEKMMIIQEMMSVTTNQQMDSTRIVIARFPEKPSILYVRIPVEIDIHSSMNIPIDEVLLFTAFTALQQQLLINAARTLNGGIS